MILKLWCEIQLPIGKQNRYIIRPYLHDERQFGVDGYREVGQVRALVHDAPHEVVGLDHGGRPGGGRALGRRTRQLSRERGHAGSGQVTSRSVTPPLVLSVFSQMGAKICAEGSVLG